VRAGEVHPITKEAQAGRVWSCPAGRDDCTREAPCVSCRGRSNRVSGMRRQAKAQKALKAITGRDPARFATLASNEENGRWPFRYEVKSGAQCGPVWTKYAAVEAQANAAKAEGDPRPLLAIFMGTRTSDGLVVCRLSELARVVEALLDVE
jgi:hypothetical protein